MLPCVAQSPNAIKPDDLRALVRQICTNQVLMLHRKDSRLRYEVHRVDRKGDTVRDQIESHDGGVARLLQHQGKPLTTDEDAGERQRLEELLGSGKLQQREREETKNRDYGAQLLQSFPDSMRFTVAAPQTPLADVPGSQLEVVFTPNPDFHPSGIAQQVLTALHGRLWIDMNDRQLLRIELQNASDVNLAWGLLAKVYTGGSAVYEQRRFQDVYTFTRINLHMRLRELMVHNATLDADTTVSKLQRLPESPSGDAAIRMLLADPVATR